MPEFFSFSSKNYIYFYKFFVIQGTKYMYLIEQYKKCTRHFILKTDTNAIVHHNIGSVSFGKLSHYKKFRSEKVDEIIKNINMIN